MIISRRAALLGGLGLGVGLAVTACSAGLPDDVPDVTPGRMIGGTFRSSYRHIDVGWSLTYPPTPAGGIEPGGHDSSYWRSQAEGQLAFIGARL